MTKKQTKESINSTSIEPATNKDKQVQTIIDQSVIADIPIELANNLSLLGKKLSSFLTYYAAGSLNRLNTLNKFIQDAEEKLYSVDVNKLDAKELNSRYREAKRAQAEIMNIARQVSQQACEADNTARVDAVYGLLKSLSADTLLELQNALSDNEYTEE